MRPFGEVVASPYDVGHTESELKELARFLKSLPGETRVLMEYTGHYYEPIAQYLHEAGIFVSVVNVILAHDYSGNSSIWQSTVGFNLWNMSPKMRSVRHLKFVTDSTISTTN